MTTRRRFLAALAALCPALACAQPNKPAGKSARVGLLYPTNPQSSLRFDESFTQGLREHGYVEGQNLVLERRYGESQAQRMAELAAELVRLKMDVIVAPTDPTIAAVKRQTQSIPIVMVSASDRSGPDLSRTWPVRARMSPARAGCPRSSARSD